MRSSQLPQLWRTRTETLLQLLFLRTTELEKEPLPKVSANLSLLLRPTVSLLPVTLLRPPTELPLYSLLEDPQLRSTDFQSSESSSLMELLEFLQKSWVSAQPTPFLLFSTRLVSQLVTSTFTKSMRLSLPRLPGLAINSDLTTPRLTQEEEPSPSVILSAAPEPDSLRRYSVNWREQMVDSESSLCVSELEWELLVWLRDATK